MLEKDEGHNTSEIEFSMTWWWLIWCSQELVLHGGQGGVLGSVGRWPKQVSFILGGNLLVLWDMELTRFKNRCFSRKV